jgi:hypothetical protein
MREKSVAANADVLHHVPLLPNRFIMLLPP